MSNEKQEALRQTAQPVEGKKLSKRTKIVFLIVVLLLIVAPALWAYKHFGLRYIEEQFDRMKLIFGETTILVLHGVILFGVPLGAALLKKYPKERALKGLFFVVTMVVLIVNTWIVTTASRTLASQRAEQFADRAQRYANNQIHSSNRATSDLVVLDQSIAKIVSYVHIMVRSEFPQFQLRAATLHVKLLNTHTNELWNVVQGGAEDKDKEFLNYPDSLAGKTIQMGTRRYCPDVMHRDKAGEDCADFQQIGQNPDYKSLVCFPINKTRDSEPFAALCFDSRSDYAFDKKLDELNDRIKNQLDNLNGLLSEYRKQDKFIFKEPQPSASPTK